MHAREPLTIDDVRRLEEENPPQQGNFGPAAALLSAIMPQVASQGAGPSIAVPQPGEETQEPEAVAEATTVSLADEPQAAEPKGKEPEASSQQEQEEPAPQTKAKGKEPTYAPIISGGLILPGGNPIHQATPTPITPTAQRSKTPEQEEKKPSKDEKLEKMKRRVEARKKKPVNIFHTPKRAGGSSMPHGARAAGSADRERELRSPQRFEDYVNNSQNDQKATTTKGLRIVSVSTIQAMAKVGHGVEEQEQQRQE